MCSITCVALCSGNLTLLETIVKADSVVVEVTADVASSIEIPRFFWCLLTQDNEIKEEMEITVLWQDNVVAMKTSLKWESYH